MFRKIGHLSILRDAANDGGGGGGDGAHPVPAPWAAATEGPWKIGEGDAAKSWWDFVPEPEAKAHVEAKGYKTPAELALANYNLTKLQRGDPTVIGLPGADAAPEAWKEFYGKLGVPATPDAYEFKFPADFKPDDGMVSWAKNAFHAANLTPQQAQLVAEKWNEYALQSNQQFVEDDAKQNAEALTALQTRWGGDLDKNKAAGLRAAQAVGLSADLISRVEQSIGSAAVVEFLAMIGRKADEGGFLGGGNPDPNNPDTMTKEQASARIAQLQGDTDFMARYNNKNDPGHAEALKTMERLYARA